MNPAAQAALDGLLADNDYPMVVVTTAANGERAGCLVGFTSQASIDPVRLLVMLSQTNETWQVAQHANTFVVHYLGADNEDLAELFGEESGDWTDKFARCEWSPGLDGVPVLAGVRGWVAGRLLARYDVGDHVAHLLEPVDAAAERPGEPLMFQAVRNLTAGHEA